MSPLRTGGKTRVVDEYEEIGATNLAIQKKPKVKLTKKQRASRNIRSAIDAEQSDRLNWPWYIYFVFILIPIVLYLTLKKNLSN